MSEWTQVAKTDDVPADGTFPATFNGEPVCLYNLDGEIFASHDVCTHGNANLSEGFVVNGHIECPFHQGKFDIRSGAPTAPPCFEPVRVWQPEVVNGELFIARD